MWAVMNSTTLRKPDNDFVVCEKRQMSQEKSRPAASSRHSMTIAIPSVCPTNPRTQHGLASHRLLFEDVVLHCTLS